MITWPTTLPLPFIDYTGTVRMATLSSSLQQGRIDRRQRFTVSIPTLQVQWILSAAELVAFQTFFNTTLHGGTALFEMELKYPRNTELNSWVVRFLQGYQARRVDSFWIISVPLELLRSSTIPAAV
jgi:hypothetical protein